MVSRLEVFVWVVTFVSILMSSEGIIGGMNIDRYFVSRPIFKVDTTTSIKNDDILLRFSTKKEKDMLSQVMEEIPSDKYPLLKELGIKNNELYVILYNNIPCIIGELKNLNKKLEMALEIINTAKMKGIEIKEIDLRTLRLPVIKEVKNNEKVN
ncbi:MAG: hypothetical protein ACP5RW_02285 [bacterium]